jgi:sugar O-acyltransferase (sialic acid O-acetyltransferase NeuD family)
MVIIGAKGHALEVLQCLTAVEREQVIFFDDVTLKQSNHVLGMYQVLHTYAEAKAYLTGRDPRFLLGLGGSSARRHLASKFQAWGGILTSVIASTAVVGPSATIGAGVNFMHHTLLAPMVTVGEGVLLNAGASVHHDSIIGDYCQISPGARILGRCRLGVGCQVGAMAVILPDITVGDHAIIGAGAVVTRPVAAGATVIGIPARRVG